jgi:uncharacterized protein with GYD domain
MALRGSIMPHYITLGKWTDQGVRNVRESPKRADAAKAMAEKLGGRMQLYYTLGEYDFVALSEAANDEIALQVALQIGSQGNARTTTLKAWTVEEATKVIAKVQ